MKTPFIQLIPKWIADIFKHDLVSGSFIPPADIRQLRDLVRYNVKLTNYTTGEKNRAQNCLTVSNLKLDSVFSDVFGKASSNIIGRILANPSEKISDVSVFRTKGMKATDEEVLAAAKAARCDEFIRKMEYGYDTLVGDAGGKLSGGERQRITIARAILKPADVVILDEASAYADPENEVYIEEAINELVKDKTLIVVAHRLETIENSDKIVVVDQGKIVAEGTQSELLKNCALYKRLWNETILTSERKRGECNA